MLCRAAVAPIFCDTAKNQPQENSLVSASLRAWKGMMQQAEETAAAPAAEPPCMLNEAQELDPDTANLLRVSFSVVMPIELYGAITHVGLLPVLLQLGLSTRLALVRAQSEERSLVRVASFATKEKRSFEVGDTVDCLARDVRWRRGIITAVCRSTNNVLVHYQAPAVILGALPATEWVDVKSESIDRLRPQATFSNEQDAGMPSELPEGVDVEVLTDECEWCPASVTSCDDEKETVTVTAQQPPLSASSSSSSSSLPPRKFQVGLRESRLRLPRTGQRLEAAERTWKSQVVKGIEFHLPEEYIVEQLLGQGSYGQVCSATQRGAAGGGKVAIKKITVGEGISGEMDALHSIRMLREVKCLRHLKSQPHIVTLHEVLVPPVREAGGSRPTEIYLVFELAFTDLGKVLRSKHELDGEHAQYLVYQTLEGLAHCHAAGVMHRDLKPDNLLLQQDCTLKITDFGLAVGTTDPSASLSNYVVTRWYRSPELLLASGDFDPAELYSPALDIWSVGCIFGELLRRKPLFPGESTFHQLKLIMTVLGSPAQGHDDHVSDPELKKYLRTAGPPAIQLQECLPKNTSPYAIDLLTKMLAFDPKRRITAEEALSHPYFADIRDKSARKVVMPSLELEVDPNISAEAALDALLGECALLMEQ